MAILIFIYGLLIGSFLNVCIYRLPRDESIAFPASHCPSCSTSLKWYDNIPLFSYLTLQGRCRYCKDKISAQYPIVEVMNAIIYLVLFYKFKLSVDFIAYALITSALIVVFFIDLKHMIIQDKLIVTIVLFEILHKLALYFTDGEVALKTSLLGAFLAGLLFLFIVVASRGGMGDGDITLIAALGFILGTRLIFLNIFLSFLIGAVVSVGLLGFKIKTRKDPIPFGPFIIIAFLLVLLFGESMINWYINLII